MRLSLVASLALTLTLATACASGGGTGGGAGSARHDRNVITADELASVDATDAYTAIQRLRPNFLQVTRGPTSLGNTRSGGASGNGEINVYVESVRIGGPTSLQQVPKDAVREIRYLSASEATQRFGTGNASGAIVVSYKAGAR